MASNSVKQTLLSEAFFFSMDTTTPEIYTLSLHDALPIFQAVERADGRRNGLALEGTPRKRSTLPRDAGAEEREEHERDRKSTRLNSSHPSISYAVFCLKKKR